MLSRNVFFQCTWGRCGGRFWPKRSDWMRSHVRINPPRQLMRLQPAGRRNENADLEERKNAHYFVQTICSYECTTCRYACLRKCADRQTNADWPTLPSYTHDNDAHASRPERAFEYRQIISVASALWHPPKLSLRLSPIKAHPVTLSP